MSLRLILTRHGKSDWNDPSLADHDRPLNERGRRSAQAIGEWLVARGHVPDAALLSTALRVRQTWSDLAAALGSDIPVTWNAALYLSTPERMMDALRSQTAARVMLIAHNPGLASLARGLAGDPPRHCAFDRFPTGATLILDFEATEWSEIGPLSGRVAEFVVPRDLVS